MYFFAFCMFSHVVCKFRCVYICVIPSCSFSASLSSGTLSSWFSEPWCQHFGKPFSYSPVLYIPYSFLPSSISNLYQFILCLSLGIYLPPTESKINCWTSWISFKLCRTSALCLFNYPSQYCGISSDFRQYFLIFFKNLIHAYIHFLLSTNKHPLTCQTSSHWWRARVRRRGLCRFKPERIKKEWC